jgi:hypothetical protein
MSSELCPRCSENATVNGICPIDQFFQPFCIRWMAHLLQRFGRATNVRILEPYRACLNCGLVWNNLRPDKLRKLREILEREEITVGSKAKGPVIDW